MREETLDEILDSLQKISQDHDMPRCYRDWAYDGISYARSQNHVEKMTFVASIFQYGTGEKLPETIEKFLGKILKSERKKGDGYASFYLARLFEEGYLYGSEETVYDLYEEASENGCRRAYEELGRLYLSGKGTDPDDRKAFLCFEKNALLGSVRSLYYLASMYKEGRFVEKDPEEAFFLYDLVHEYFLKNHDHSMRGEIYEELSSCHLYGTGTIPDYHDALFFAQQAETDYRERRRDGERGLKEKIARAQSLQEEARMMMEDQE